MKRLLLLAMLTAQSFSTLQVELVSGGFPGGEGPVWSREGFLIFSDYSRDRLYKYVPGAAPRSTRRTRGTNGNTMDAQGRLYPANTAGGPADRQGKMRCWPRGRFNAPNDIVVRRDGHVIRTRSSPRSISAIWISSVSTT
jgi:gluconolactonase